MKLCDGDPCSFPPAECVSINRVQSECCRFMCAKTDWRDRGGLAGFLTNFTRNFFGLDDNVPSIPSTDIQKKGEGFVPIQSGFRRNLTSLRAPFHRIVEATRRDHFSLQDITPEEDWENIDFSARPEPYSGGYEAIIIGITLLILCLIVIAVIFILALYRLRKIRLLGRCRNRSRPVDNNSAHTINVSYISEPPPAYQDWKPVCALPPPSYEQHMQTTDLPPHNAFGPSAQTTAASPPTTDQMNHDQRSLARPTT